ncbi:hypothetical protein SAMN04487950_4629 [Halogranum rubrum]|uniref:Uncharacterized protein n=1 Tax=Halogranum rubrum TaxID=553466 RepID=A0A1I4JS31_9EURY|nr:hypothetical protein [Halogranum rubrum]SFL69415.1 hypothetical protein SAMN04487950_4629 [Halogranum rubrum]
MNLVLQAPDDIPISRLIRAYFAHRVSKTNNEERRENTRAAGEELAENVSTNFEITEDIPRAVIETYGGEPMVEIFRSESGQFETIHGDKIVELIRILREAGETTQQQGVGPESWDPLRSMEERVIALCEFAFQNDYSLSISF